MRPHTILILLSIAFLITLASVESRAGSRLSPQLQKAAQTGVDETIAVLIILSGENQLDGLVEDTRLIDAGGIHMLRGKVQVKNLTKLATSPGVEAVMGSAGRPAPKPVDPDLKQTHPPVNIDMKQASRLAPPYSSGIAAPKPSSPGDTPNNWWGNEFIGVNGAGQAGYDGEGVKVAVIDTGVDFAHPDLQGVQARVNNPASPHHGWPICFDGRSMSTFCDRGTTQGTYYVDTSSAPLATTHGATATARFTILNKGTSEEHEFVFKAESVSGVYHFGLHPDTSLINNAWNGVTPAILVVDSSDTATRGPGYNTVYVDLNNNRDFTDDKACYRGDEISYWDYWDSASWDFGSDGYADISGGMVYFIANGVRPLPAADWLYNQPTPANGSLVAFMINDDTERGGDHGTVCVSQIAAQGVINGYAPDYKPAYTGPGDGMVQGAAQKAGVIALGNYYAGGYVADFHLFAALGYDGVAETGDEANIVSMSFGSGSTDNDGWNYWSRFIDRVSRQVAPRTSWMDSSGNGGPGYATVNSPGAPRGIHVGASTQYGSCNHTDSIQYATQVQAGDVASFSCSGPHSNGHIGTMVLANGSLGSGCIPLNSHRDGWGAWKSWGGTSRSCPEAAGVLALVYQAYYQAHGQWPTATIARQLLMNGATNQHYDCLKQGAGRVNALRSVNLARNHDGIAVSPPFLVPGDYRGTRYDAYASLVERGDTLVETFTVTNHGTASVQLYPQPVVLIEYASLELTVNTIASSSEESQFRKPDYLIPLHNASLDNIPANCDLMIVEAIFPFEDFDTDFVSGQADTVKPFPENNYRVLVYNWADLDGDGKLFDDSLGQAVGIVESNEIDSGEFVRFNYGYNSCTTVKACVQNPLGRMHDGIWIGLRHTTRPAGGCATPIRIRVRFFKQNTPDWLSIDENSVVVPASGTSDFHARYSVPADMPYGVHTAKILLLENGAAQESAVVLPTLINVAANITSVTGEAIALGGAPYAATIYRNGEVRGDSDWGDDDEAGDGRLFFLDAVNPQPGDYLLLNTTWEDALPTDIDTLIFAPEKDLFSSPGGDYYDPEYGPNTLTHAGGERSPGRPWWLFSTNTNSTEEYATALLQDGLHAVFMHNILFSGHNFAVPFSAQAGVVNLKPYPLEFNSQASAIQESVTITSNMAFEDVTFQAWGPSPFLPFRNEPIHQGDQNDILGSSWTRDFMLSDCALFEMKLSSPAPDLDMFLLRDGADGAAPDGVYKFPAELVDRSESGSSTETIRLSFPIDGDYRLVVFGWSVPQATGYFSLDIDLIQGRNVTVMPTSPIDINVGAPVGVSVQSNLTQYGAYRVYLSMKSGQSKNVLDMSIPLFYCVPGDVDENGIVDRMDALLMSRYWHGSRDTPIAVDFDRNEVFDAADLVHYIKASQQTAPSYWGNIVNLLK
jgi:subtilisin family serine protease